MPYAQPIQHSVLQEQGVPDGTLVKLAQTGDQSAFDSLVSRYHLILASYIRGFLKDDEQVSDVLQHVYLKLYLSLPLLLTNVSLKGWLFQVARNRCLDELRKKRRHVETPFSALVRDENEEEISPIEAIPDTDPLPEEVAERLDLHCSLQKAIASLPPKFRSIVHLYCFRQLSFAEIGRKLNIPASTAKTNYYRSLPHLRKALVSSTNFVAVS